MILCMSLIKLLSYRMQIEYSLRDVGMVQRGRGWRCERHKVRGAHQFARDPPTAQIHVYCTERRVAQCIVSRSTCYVEDHNLRVAVAPCAHLLTHVTHLCGCSPPPRPATLPTCAPFTRYHLIAPAMPRDRIVVQIGKSVCLAVSALGPVALYCWQACLIREAFVGLCFAIQLSSFYRRLFLFSIE